VINFRVVKKAILTFRIEKKLASTLDYGYIDGAYSDSTLFEKILNPASLFSGAFHFWVEFKARN
jgi:hypothetical protein